VAARLCCVHYSVYRYSNRLSALISLVLFQPTIYVHYSVWRYYNQISSVLCHHSTLPVDITPDYLLYQLSPLISLALLQSKICCDLLGLVILQPRIRSTLPVDSSLYALSCLLILQSTIHSTHSACRYYNRLPALRVPTIRYTLSGFTPIDHLL
jgi:hypothetical protein